MNELPIFKEVALKPAEEFSEPPDVSLFFMAKNAEACIVRLLDNVGEYIREVVAVLNDCTDGTKGKIEGWCAEKGKKLVIVEVTAESHPELYLFDTAATYQMGHSLAGEELTGPFVERPILADWASARNLGWNLCTCRWRLFLDADDVVLDPWAIPGVCETLDEHGADLACTLYQFDVDNEGRPRGTSYRERLARNVPHIQWASVIHELLVGATNPSHIQGNFVVWDKRDNVGHGVRLPGRNFKILYHQAREADWDISPRALSHLLMEVRHMIADGVDMLDFADAVYELHAKRSTWPEELAWTAVMMGEIYERQEEYEVAVGFYRKSLEHHPGAKAAFRLSRALFQMHDWQGCLDMYERGLENQQVHHVLDDGAAHAGMGAILAAGACVELGLASKGLEYVETALKAYPGRSALLTLQEQLKASVEQFCNDCGERILGAHGHCPGAPGGFPDETEKGEG